MTSRCAIITGAGSGIGQAVAVELSRAGFDVVLVGRREATLAETAKLCADSITLAADVSDPSSADRIVSAAIDKSGRIDALVNNAGYAPVVQVKDLAVDEWRKIIDTNLSSAIYLIRAAWPYFAKQNSGTIVNISSESARDPFLGLGAYGAAKAALNLLTKALAQEGAPINVKAYAIAPAAVETQMLRQIVSANDLPTSSTLLPDDVAQVIVQCITGPLAHANGEVIYIHK